MHMEQAHTLLLQLLDNFDVGNGKPTTDTYFHSVIMIIVTIKRRQACY